MGQSISSVYQQSLVHYILRFVLSIHQSREADCPGGATSMQGSASIPLDPRHETLLIADTTIAFGMTNLLPYYFRSSLIAVAFTVHKPQNRKTTRNNITTGLQLFERKQQSSYYFFNSPLSDTSTPPSAAKRIAICLAGMYSSCHRFTSTSLRTALTTRGRPAGRGLATVSPATSTSRHHKVVVIGNGSAGVAVSHQLLRKGRFKKDDIAVVDPSTWHHYQPGWTLVSGG